MREEYGIDPITPSHLRIALSGLGGEPFTNQEGEEITLVPESFLLPDGTTDWASYFDARDSFIEALDPTVRRRLAEYRLLRDEESIVPNMDQFRKAAEFQRELQQLPRYYQILQPGDARYEELTDNLGADDPWPIKPVAMEDQGKVRLLHTWVLNQTSASDVKGMATFFAEYPDLYDKQGILSRDGSFQQQDVVLRFLRDYINDDPDGAVELWFGSKAEGQRVYRLLLLSIEGDKEAPRHERRTGEEPRERVARREEINKSFEWRLPDGSPSGHGVLEVVYGGVSPHREPLRSRDFANPDYIVSEPESAALSE